MRSPRAAAVAGGSLNAAREQSSSVLPLAPLLEHLEQTRGKTARDVRLTGAPWVVLAALRGCVAPSVFALKMERPARWCGLLLAEHVPHHL